MGKESTSAVVHFLQTAVVLDDEAYESLELDQPAEDSASLEGETLDVDFDFPEDMTGGLEGDQGGGVLDEMGEEARDRPRALITEPLVEGFADFGIACSVLKPLVPGREEEDHDRLRAMARRADIVILDWQLTGPNSHMSEGLGKSDGTSLSFLIELLKEDQKFGSRFRLICVYTGNPAVDEIMHRIRTAVSDVLNKVVTVGPDMSITEGPLKIVLVSKKRLHVPEVASSRTAADLPSLMVKEFESLVSTGLLPDLALSALSAVRDGAHHLLHRFDSALDPALISHFSRVGVEGTADLVRTLITDELSSILSVPPAVDYLEPDSMTERISSRLQGSGPPYYLAANKDATKCMELDLEGVHSALAESVGTGSFTAPMVGSPNNRKKVDPPSLTSLFLEGDDWDVVFKDALLIDRRLSVLSCMTKTTTSIGTLVPPVLQSGSVLMSGQREEADGTPHGEETDRPDEDRFWLCLQPLCDSLRLTKPTSFPLIPLRPNHAQFADIVVDYWSDMLPLTTHGVKFNQIVMPTFVPSVQRRVVEATRNESGGWTYKDAGGLEYTWLGQVRQWKVQKMVSGIASSLDRIGLDEYEYLRKLSSH